MQVQCGSQTRVIHSEILDKDMFDPAANMPRHTSWTMQLLSRLDQVVGPGVMDSPVFSTTEKQEHPKERPDTPVLQELNSGKFDALFSKAPDQPSALYRASQDPLRVPEIRLLDSLALQPDVFVLPKYPPIAKAAHVQGSVV